MKINSEKLIEKYKGKIKLYKLNKFEDIVGQEIEEDTNRLVYIIREKGKYRVSYAENELAEPNIVQTEGKSEVIKIDFEKILQQNQLDQKKKPTIVNFFSGCFSSTCTIS